LEPDIESLDQLNGIIQREFNLSANSFRVEYWDKDFDEFVTLPNFDYLETKARLNVVEITASQGIRSRSSSTESINSDHSKSQQRTSKSYSLDMGNPSPIARDEQSEKSKKRVRQNNERETKESKEKPFKISPQDVAKLMEQGLGRDYSPSQPKVTPSPTGPPTKRLGKTTYETFPDPPNKPPATSTKSHPPHSFPNKNPRPSKAPWTKDYMDTSNLPAPKSHSFENLSISTSSSTGSSSNSDSPQLRVSKKSDPLFIKREKRVKTKPLPLKKEGSSKRKKRSKNKKDQ